MILSLEEIAVGRFADSVLLPKYSGAKQAEATKLRFHAAPIGASTISTLGPNDRIVGGALVLGLYQRRNSV